MNFDFCPRCGNKLVLTNENPCCESCGFVCYANPVPSAAVITQKGGKFVLVRRDVEPGKGGLAFPGGFMEEGESPEEAARREFNEETGMHCTGLTLLCVIPVKYVVPGVEKDVLCIYFYAKNVSGTPKAGVEETEVVFKTAKDLSADDLVISDNKAAFNVFKKKYSVV